MVNYWATWCAPCRKEMPKLDAFYRKYHPQGLEMVGISIDFERDLEKARKAARGCDLPDGLCQGDLRRRAFGTPKGARSPGLSMPTARYATVLSRYATNCSTELSFRCCRIKERHSWRPCNGAVVRPPHCGNRHSFRHRHGAPPANAGAWVTDVKSGCQVWNPNPQLEETVAWSGPCANGRAQGHGTVHWLKDERPSETDEGEWRDGRQVGTGTQSWSSGRYDGELLDGEPNGQVAF